MEPIILTVLLLLAGTLVGLFYIHGLRQRIRDEREKLAKSEAQWSHALDFLDDPIYMVDLQDRIIRANRAFYKKINASPQEAVGRVVTDFTHPEGEESPCKVCQARQSLQDIKITLEADDPVNKAGNPMEISIRVVQDEAKQPIAIIQKMTDLTSVRETETLIRRSEALFRGILDATPEPLIASDENGKITLVNSRFEDIFGYRREEVLGQKIEILVPDKFRKKHVEQRDQYTHEDEPYEMAERRELCGLHKDGHEIPLEITLNSLKAEGHTLVIASMHEISQRRKVERELRHLASFPEQNPIPIIEFETGGRITYRNPAAMEIFPDLSEKSFAHPFLVGIENILDMLQSQSDVVRDIDIGNEIYEQKITYNAETDLYRIYAWDITKIRNMTRQMAYQASHDALTGMLNRREFEKRLDDALQISQFQGKQHTLCYMDLDQFKIVNDTCGHIAGDELLKQLGSVLQSNTRESDSLARLGGDEFGLLLMGCPVEKAEVLAEKLRKAIEDFRFRWDHKTFKLGVSIGLVSIDARSGNISDILSAADSACYIAKEQGRNRYHVYKADDAVLSRHTDEMNWIHRIHMALDNSSFVLYCQKVVSVDTPENEYFEVLVRMRDTDGKLISPNAFLPAAERFDLMTFVDQWVIENTLQVMNQPGYTGFAFAINLSGQTLNDSRVLHFIIDMIDKCEIDPERICFEITETAMIANLNSAVKFASTLRGMGCKIALDDFGSGLSSFSYLKNLPVNYLKIDGSLVREIDSDPINLAMVESITQIARAMGLKTVAEFVENDAIFNKLRHINIDFAQGYGIEKPKPLTDLMIIPQCKVNHC